MILHCFERVINMKYLLVIGCLLLVTDVIRADQQNMVEVLKEYITPCAQEHNILPEELSKLEDPNLEGEDRNRFGCLNACVIKKTEILVGSELQEDKYREITQKLVGDDPDKIAAEVNVAKTCLDEVKDKTEECEFAFEFSRCIQLKNRA